jgi:hypothetical protein
MVFFVAPLHGFKYHPLMSGVIFKVGAPFDNILAPAAVDYDRIFENQYQDQ